ncbi:alpha-amylase family glycosyl hydrolase [Hymenobacter sp. BT491]|uniref:alpha-amylase family glycosyl hydrolase n=1 Tax=Hymenobacter sp. BT491 TaxID=2766779 RepID=UPI0021CCF96E|nr:alpha-amylase family glycosyl hydrolase [Hymenobacter sp. BT491]
MQTLQRAWRLLAVLLLMGPAAWAQVVTTQPSPFRDTDQVTITFDATKGNAGLAAYAGDVYIWTGVITNLSANNSDWKHVKGTSFGAPIAEEKMTPLGNHKYSITFTPRSYYPGLASSTEKVLKLAMVFRGAAGTPEGKGDGNSDILVDVAQDQFNLSFTSPAGAGPFYVTQNASLTVTGTASTAADLALFLNGTQVAQQANATSITANVPIAQAGANTLRLTATSGATTASTEIQVLTRPTVVEAPLPAGAKKDGITYLAGGTSAILSLSAPNKQFVYAIGEFNNWQQSDAYFMKHTAERTPEGDRWWIQLDNLTPGQEYAYQYLVDGQLRIADPYTEKILSPTDDQYINTATYTVYPNLKAYPTGKTTGNVSVLQTNQAAYQWQVTNFQRPTRKDLVIYELLIRDFVARHDYKTLTDTLNYIQRLGINAIELMPINEFEGNESWGYNPSFFFAPDKYYGTKNDLKHFIDECHRRGIAVILDMVLNHSFGQSPMVQLYFDGSKPTAASPWFNVDAKHPYNVGYDFNHESAYTKYFTKQVMSFWLQEYKIDGYRFDLAGGFSQRQTTEATYGTYDQSRIDIWKDYYQHLMSVDAKSYPILEHFPENSEGKVLADYGFMLWGNLNYNYNEATMGYVSTSDLSSGYYGQRGWAQPNLITYMESHDEERLTFKNITYGNATAPPYNVKDPKTSLTRDAMAAAFFFTVPGPKLVWQFGELGYDFTINRCTDGTVNNDCRLSNKPIRWDYQQDANRKYLFNVYRSLIELKKMQPVFENPVTYTQQLTGAAKSIHLSDADLSVTIIGNFDVTATAINPAFQSTGTWYDYLTDGTLNVTDATAQITLQPGEFRVLTSKKINRAAGVTLPNKRSADAASLQLLAVPNPAGHSATLHYELTAASPVTVAVQNLLGATVRTVPAARQGAGQHDLTLPVGDLSNGIYLIRLSAGNRQQTTRLVVQH